MTEEKLKDQDNFYYEQSIKPRNLEIMTALGALKWWLPTPSDTEWRNYNKFKDDWSDSW